MEANIPNGENYFSLALIVLESLDEFTERVIEMSLKNNLSEELSEIIQSLKELFESANKEDIIVERFKSALKKEYEQFGDLGDSRELILCILSLVHECCENCIENSEADLCPSHQLFSYFDIKEKSETEGYEHFAIVIDSVEKKKDLKPLESKYSYQAKTYYNIKNCKKFTICCLDYDEVEDESSKAALGKSFYSFNHTLGIDFKSLYEDQEYSAKWLIFWNGIEYSSTFLGNKLNGEELEYHSNLEWLSMIIYKRDFKDRGAAGIITHHQEEDSVDT